MQRCGTFGGLGYDDRVGIRGDVVEGLAGLVNVIALATTWLHGNDDLGAGCTGRDQRLPPLERTLCLAVHAGGTLRLVNVTQQV